VRSARSLGALATLALGCAAQAPGPPLEPALVALEVLRGFGAPPARSDAPQLIALVDATSEMSRRDASGLNYADAARAAAQRFLRALPDASSVELRALGGVRSAGCGSPARTLTGPVDVASEALVEALANLSPAGEGSLAEALFAIAAELPDAGPQPSRVVAFSALRDRCDASLCAAAESLARGGARLDLVVLGGARVPACLADIDLPEDLSAATTTRSAAVGFRVERLGPEPAVVGCSEARGLPIAVPLGPARVVVALDPPLVLERSFPPGTRWILEIVDFPALGPGERQWRWRPFAERAAAGHAR
jgi:hypothetical protein